MKLMLSIKRRRVIAMLSAAFRHVSDHGHLIESGEWQVDPGDYEAVLILLRLRAQVRRESER
jgi:hypothetical protein